MDTWYSMKLAFYVSSLNTVRLALLTKKRKLFRELGLSFTHTHTHTHKTKLLNHHNTSKPSDIVFLAGYQHQIEPTATLSSFCLMNRFIHLKLWQYKPRIKADYVLRDIIIDLAVSPCDFFIVRADRKSRDKQCLGFGTADFLGCVWPMNQLYKNPNIA